MAGGQRRARLGEGGEAPRSHHDDTGDNDGLGQEFDTIVKGL